MMGTHNSHTITLNQHSSQREMDTDFSQNDAMVLSSCLAFDVTAFLLVCFLICQQNTTLDPTLAMYYHAVPLISSRWHCIYSRCNVAL